MGRKEKEEERIERIIRGLLKLPENRRCINCNALRTAGPSVMQYSGRLKGPQYVCTTFSTFVCTNCSGVHREFTHRVKSVSMAKFNVEEVSALQAAGNERARHIYFKEWDPQRNSYPDCSNLSKLRDFIKHVYVDRRYTGDRNQEKLLGVKSSNKEELFESRMACTYHGGSRNSYVEDRYEQNERPGPSGWSNSYNNERSLCSPENSRGRNFTRNTAHFEVVDDRFRDYGVQSGRKPDIYRFLHRKSRAINSSPGQKKNINHSNSPMVRPIKDILGAKAKKLQVGKCSKLTDAKNPAGSAPNQMVSPSGSTISSTRNPVEQKGKNADSFTSENSDTKSSEEAAEPQTHKNLSSSEGDTSSHELSVKEIIPLAPTMTTLELLLLELSVPTLPSNGTEVSFSSNTSTTASCSNMPSSAVPPGQMLTPLNSIGISGTASADSIFMNNVSPAAPSGQMQLSPKRVGDYTTSPGGNIVACSVSSSVNGGQITLCDGFSSAHPMFMSKSTDNSGDSAIEKTGGTIPAGGISSASSAGGTLSLLDNLNSSTMSTATDLPAQNFTSDTISDVSIVSISRLSNGLEVRGMQQYKPSVFAAADGSSTTKETTTEINNLENQNLFTASYSPYNGSISSWQNDQSYSTVYGPQYYTNRMHNPAYPSPAKSTNPFDFNHETTLQQATTYPFMGHLSGAFPDTSAPQFASHTFSIGHNSSGSIAKMSPSYGSAVLAHSSTVPSAMSTGAYLEQQIHMNPLPSGCSGN